MKETMMSYSVGQRVRIADDYFVAHLRGAIGTITDPGDNLRDYVAKGDYWIEFDEMHPDENGELTEASAVDATDLRPIE